MTTRQVVDAAAMVAHWQKRADQYREERDAARELNSVYSLKANAALDQQRFHAATAAMQGLLAQMSEPAKAGDLVIQAVACADSLLAALAPKAQP